MRTQASTQVAGFGQAGSRVINSNSTGDTKNMSVGVSLFPSGDIVVCLLVAQDFLLYLCYLCVCEGAGGGSW